jgi:hypothetical protein
MIAQDLDAILVNSYYHVTAISPQLENSLRWFDMDMIAIYKTLAACKVFVPRVRFNLVSV